MKQNITVAKYLFKAKFCIFSFNAACVDILFASVDWVRK